MCRTILKKRHTYQSKHNLKCKNLVIFLIITDVKKWHYLAVKKLSALLRGITCWRLLKYSFI